VVTSIDATTARAAMFKTSDLDQRILPTITAVMPLAVSSRSLSAASNGPPRTPHQLIKAP
jgi:hypothetical protein